MGFRELMILKAMNGGGGGYVQATATGNPLTFNTDVAKPLKSLLIPWTPSQSGSGDPSPSNVRPISGVSAVNVWQTGANLIDDSKRYQQYAGYSLYIGSTGTTYDYFLKSGTYTFSAEMFNGASYDMYYRKSDGQAVYIWKSTDGVTSASFTLTKDGYYRFNFGGATKENVGRCWLNYGESASEYSPYAGTTIPVTFPALGKNLWHTDVAYQDGNAYKSDGQMVITDRVETSYLIGGSQRDIEFYLPAGTYTLSASSQTFVGIYAVLDDLTSWASGVTKTFSDEVHIRAIRCTTKLLNDPGTYYWQLQIEKGSSATSYEPYTNTVYGGTLDVVSGVLTVEWKNVAIKDLAWVYANDGYFYANVNDHKQPPIFGGLGLLCSAIPYGGTKWASVFEDGYMYDNSNSKSIYVKDTSCADTDALKTKYGNYSIVYPLDESIVYSLSDLATITTLVGDNVIWSDTNGTNTVVYLKRG